MTFLPESELWLAKRRAVPEEVVRPPQFIKKISFLFARLISASSTTIILWLDIYESILEKDQRDTFLNDLECKTILALASVMSAFMV